MSTLLLAGVFLVPMLGYAQNGVLLSASEQKMLNDIVKDEAIVLSDLEIETPGLLQTNPFYFFKNWRRSTQKTFAFSTLKKAELQLDFLNERAAEIKLFFDINAANEDALGQALDTYTESVTQLQSYMSALKPAPQDESLSALLDTLVDKSTIHSMLFDELKNNAGSRLRDKFTRAQSAMSMVTMDAMRRLGTPSDFYLRFIRVYAGQRHTLLREIRVAEALSYFLENNDTQNPLFNELILLKEHMAITALGKIAGNGMDVSFAALAIEQVPGDALRRILTIDMFREFSQDSEFLNHITVARQRMLEESEEDRVIGKPQATLRIEHVKKASAFIAQALQEKIITSKAVSALQLRTLFNIEQAEASLAGGQYVDAFGQASAAAASAQNAVGYIIRVYNNFASVTRELQDLKYSFDILTTTITELGFTKETNPELFVLLQKAEKALVTTSDLLVEKKVRVDTLIPSMREALRSVIAVGQKLEILVKDIEAAKAAAQKNESLIKRVLPQ
ncbi:MAG: DUF5667 domain-containing protein [bacterium]|nr:DUF5667 domain-containing protein [bacterium]